MQDPWKPEAYVRAYFHPRQLNINKARTKNHRVAGRRSLMLSALCLLPLLCRLHCCLTSAAWDRGTLAFTTMVRCIPAGAHLSMSEEIWMVHTWNLLRDGIAMARLALPWTGISVSHNIFYSSLYWTWLFPSHFCPNFSRKWSLAFADMLSIPWGFYLAHSQAKKVPFVVWAFKTSSSL